MPVERSAGIIFFRSTPAKGRRYLVIRSSYHGKNKKHDFWDFPKGLLEDGEDGFKAAKRESTEEVGIKDFEIVTGFKETVRYFVRGRPWGTKAVIKFVAMFLAEAKTSKVKLSWEHDKYEWATYKRAYDLISRKEMKQPLKKAEEFLKER